MQGLKYLAEVIIFEEVVIMSLLMSYPDNFDLFRSPFERMFSNSGLSGMKTDIEKKETETVYTIEMPGMKKGDIEISLEKGILSISASKQKQVDESDDEKNYVLHERSSESYSRSFKVNEKLTKDDITATLEDGVLELHVPHVAESDSGKQIIEIN